MLSFQQEQDGIAFYGGLKGCRAAPDVRRMIGSMFRDGLSWLVGLIESVSVVVAILIVGLVFGMAGFWIHGRSLRKLGGPPAEFDSEEHELDEDVAGQVVSTQQDEDSPPSER